MNVSRTLGIGTAVLLCTLSITLAQQSGGEQAETDEAAITMADVPVNVSMAAQAVATAEGYQIQDVSTEVERDGRLNYEFGGEGFEIDITADGTLDEIERTSNLGELPQEVQNTLQGLLQGFEPSTVETSTRPEGVVVYEFEGQLGDSDVDIELSADAQEMTISLE